MVRHASYNKLRPYTTAIYFSAVEVASARPPAQTVLFTLTGCWVLLLYFFFNDTATTEIYTLSLHDALPIYTNVVRMAMTPFFHGCLAGIFGYFIALATLDPARRWPLLVAGLAISATLHGLFDALVPRSPMWGV